MQERCGDARVVIIMHFSAKVAFETGMKLYLSIEWSLGMVAFFRNGLYGKLE
jgi:hypothetical protein